jgi:hypothetical protein
MMQPDSISKLRAQVVTAIRQLQTIIRWKPGKDLQHLQTRLEYGHLPPSAKLADYEMIIANILSQAAADVYVYIWRQDVYPTIMGNYENHRWLVMFSLNGVMETAFPPTDPEAYLADSRFHYMGTIQELLA